MKKTTVATILTTVGATLFSFQLGNSLVHADETTESSESGVVETLPGEGVPDAGTEIGGGSETPAQLETPTQPGTDPVTPEPELPEPTLPTEPIEGGEGPGTTPTDPGTSETETLGTTETLGSTTGSSTTEQPTTPSASKEPEQPTEESTQPSEEQPTEEPKEDKDTKPKEDKPATPAKEVTVSVDTSGKITTGAAQGTSVPIVTSDVKEISHVPTPTTPLKAASGQTIVGVKEGVPLVQDAQGNLVEDPSIPVKELPSGNIEVKTADGKTKVLPKTGEEVQAALSLLGILLTSVAGFFGYKKKKNVDEVSY
ncbi:hypothetical protein IGI96_001740 [Enterococcus sp. DIV0421]|uniref:LPXTG cell wall anchor domain-containing protein n=1 Tax=Enterococcus sp. DIV0421 TaxID=2774688 RepID=UPI003F25B787